MKFLLQPLIAPQANRIQLNKKVVCCSFATFNLKNIIDLPVRCPMCVRPTNTIQVF